MNLLLSQSKELAAFLRQADWEDAGQTAALDVLGADLGQTAATFLGEGNWRPNRKAMIACWKAAQTEGPDSDISGDSNHSLNARLAPRHVCPLNTQQASSDSAHSNGLGIAPNKNESPAP